MIEGPLASRPDVPPHLLLVWQAFWDLSGDRNVDPKTGRSRPIPFTAIDRWAQRFGYDGDDFESLHSLLKEMDTALLSWSPPPPES